MDFDAIYREYQPRIFRYLSQLTCEADAHDLTQAVFLKVSRSLESFRGDSSLATWLFRIATNTARDFADSALARQREGEYLPEEPAELEALAVAPEPHAEDQLLRQEMNDCIQEMVRDMPENYREVVVLSEFAELSNAEIAEVLGITLDAVKIRLHRGRKALRTQMECQCNLYHDARSELMCDRK
jgi:RNA polymerase sigma-70 factor (ECF subfamily)